MNERLHHLSTPELSPRERYKNILVKTENYCVTTGADHRFVGGTIADLLSPNTNISVDPERQMVILKNYPPLTVLRPDGSVKDIDVIFFTKSFAVFQTARQDFASWQKEAKRNSVPFPAISAEAARHPHWSPRNSLRQFVTAWEIDSNNIPSLNFGSVHQPINPLTIEPWTYKLEDDQIKLTGLNPFGFALCYVLRVPSGVKMKEKHIDEYVRGYKDDGTPVMAKFNKMSLVMGLAAQTHRESQNYSRDLKARHKEWIDYIHSLQYTDDSSIRLKAAVTDWYWRHLGTKIAHGKGFLGMLSRFNDRMSG